MPPYKVEYWCGECQFGELQNLLHNTELEHDERMVRCGRSDKFKSPRKADVLRHEQMCGGKKREEADRGHSGGTTDIGQKMGALCHLEGWQRETGTRSPREEWRRRETKDAGNKGESHGA